MQVRAFSLQLQTCKDQLNDACQMIQQLTSQVEQKEDEISELKEAEDDKQTEMMAQLKQGSTSRETLLRQLESSNAEIMMLSQRVSALQESSIHAHQLEGEVLQLRKSLSEQQGLRINLQGASEDFERERKKIKEENKAMRDRLEKSSLQLTEMQRRSEEWRSEREKISRRNKEVGMGGTV